jgi:GT2 family glycosyltransferase
MPRSGIPVIVLNWNGWADSFRCLRSLARTSEASEVWLVDNASTTDLRAEASAFHPGLRAFRWEDNYGFAGGYNRALKIAVREGYEFAYLLNNDASVTPGFLNSVIAMARENDRIAAVGSRVLRDGETSERMKSQTAIVGAGVLVRLRAMEEHGYFDERFFCYCEEVEWCLRLQRQGWLCVACPDSVIIHKGEGSDHDANAIYYRVRNRFLVAELAFGRLGAEEKRRLLYETAVVAEEARRAGEFQRWVAAACGLDDALRGRFGRRQPSPLRLVAGLRLAWCSLRASVGDKLRSLRVVSAGGAGGQAGP